MKRWLIFTLAFLFLLIGLVFTLKRESEIYNGEVVEKRIPFTVRTLRKDNLKCVASFLNERFLITAAHCVFDVLITPMKFGFVWGTNTIESSSEKKKNVLNINIHPKFLNNACNHYDVAILEMISYDQFLFDNDNIQATKLNTDKLANGTVVHALGWGLTTNSTEKITSNKLLRTTEVVVGMENCKPKATNCSLITNDTAHFCASSPTDQVNCPSDSGGPVINEADELVGIVCSNTWFSSFPETENYLKCQPKANSIYVSIHDIQDWIYSSIIQQELFVWGYSDVNLWGSMPSQTYIEPSQLNKFNTNISPIIRKIHLPYGSNFVLGISLSNRLYSWGSNSSYLGYGTDIPYAQPESATFLNISNVKDVCGGYRHAIALTDDNKLYGWGDNTKKQVDPSDNRQWIPIPQLINLKDSPIIVSIACGAEHSIAVAKDRLYTWGSNQYGQLGQNTQGSCAEDSSRFGNETLIFNKISKACAGLYTTLVIVDGSAYIFGSNLNGIAGIGTKTPTTICTPHWIGGNETYSEAYCGESNFFITKDDQVYGWGSNTRKIIKDSADFVTVPTLTNIKGVNLVIGSEHVLFQKDKKWYGVGSNEHGQLTRMDISNAVHPVEIQFLNSRKKDVYKNMEVSCRGRLCISEASTLLAAFLKVILLMSLMILSLL